MVLNIFRLIGGNCNHAKTYLDLGAHHPTTISNTRLLYERGWRGVNIEANPELIPAFHSERPEDTTVQIGVGPETTGATFYKYSPTSGRNTFSKDEVATLEGVLKVSETVPLNLWSVNRIVERFCGGVWPAFLSVDIEGLDHAVLESADFSASAPMVICVETRRHETEARRALLEQKGFFLYCRMGENLFFVRKDFKEVCY